MNLFDTILCRSPKPMQTKYCISCKKVKAATPENFQRSGKAFRNPCKSCQVLKRKSRKVPITPEVDVLNGTFTTETGFIPDISTQDIEAFGRVCEALMSKFDRSFFLKVEKDMKSELRAYGDHSEQFYGKTPQEVIDIILG